MKIKKLKLKNFHEFTDFECEFNDQITRLVGINGSGKTTIGLTAIWACLKGISERSKDGQLIGERFRFIGKGRPTSDIELTLIDETMGVEIVVKNHISKATNHMSFKAPDDYPVNQKWLNGLLNVAFISARHFASIDSKQQATLLGIDTSKYDADISNLKAEYTLLNRDYTNFGELVEPEKVEEVKVDKLALELQTLQDIDQKHYDKTEEDWLDSTETTTNLKNDIVQLKADLQEKERLLKTAEIDSEKQFKVLERLENPVDKIAKIQGELKTAGETNKKYNTWKTWDDDSKDKAKAKKLVDANQAKQKVKTKERLDYIKKFNFGFDNMSVGENGELLLNDRPIKEPYYSKGELEIVVAKLFMSKDPELRYRFIDDLQDLDDKNQTKIIDSLLKEGFQILTAEVGDKKVKDNTLLIKECGVVESYDQKKNLI
ncbi:MAG TPA: hypothetical protein ENH87_02060 [Pricia antarctica]|uniref:Rad50/SbcC-type AAA domain-containing protein n=1 Tax=Pricia antarctica TaxID=641691 RepID=A0A831QN01_9FLAO|nr:hypothetical protein [Pricia antarctica]